MTYGHGTIDVLRSGRFRLRTPDGKGKYKPIGTYDTMDEAERMQRAAAIAQKRIPDGAATIADYGDMVIPRWKLSGKSSYKADISRWNIVKTHADWAQLPPDMVNRGVIKDFLVDLLSIDSERGSPYSPQSIKHVLILIRSIYKEAVDNELVDTNPALEIASPKGTSIVDNWTSLSTEEIAAVARCNRLTRLPTDQAIAPWPADKDLLSYEVGTVILLVVYTGLRQGECAALEWANVIDLDGAEPHLWISRSWNRPYTKTRKPRRVDLIPLAVALLKQWRSYVKGSLPKFVWGALYSYGYDWGWAIKTDFTNEVCYIGAKRIAGISRRVTFHHLRDTCASHLLTGTWGMKWTIAEVATLLGHTTTYVTERYARILPGAMAEIARNTYRKPAAALPIETEQKSRENKGRAMQDSNLRLLAPEANLRSAISNTYQQESRRVGGSALRLLQELGNGRVPDASSLLKLAEDLLEEETLTGTQAKLATKILIGGANALPAAIELAGLLRPALAP